VSLTLTPPPPRYFAAARFLLAVVVLVLLLISSAARADTYPQSGRGSSSSTAQTLVASPVGKALCPFVVKNGSTVELTVDCSGNVTANYVTDNGGMSVSGNAMFTNIFTNNVQRAGLTLAVIGGPSADGASAIGTIFSTNGTYATTGAKLVSFQNNLVEKAWIDYSGRPSFFGADMQTQRINSVATGVVVTDAANVGQLRPYALHSGACISTSGSKQTCAHSLLPSAGTVTRLTWANQQPGTGASTHTFAVEDYTSSTVLCVSSAVACTDASNGVSLSCSGAIVSGHDIALTESTGCTTNPTGTLTAVITWQ
jgi:hypothetical protein